MDFDEFQRRARLTDITGDGLIVPLLGIGGEAGELLSEYKKLLRDGTSHTTFTARVAEELGDVLWYAAALANRLGLGLSDIAASNLKKCDARWGADQPAAFDLGFPSDERLPRHFIVRIETLPGEPFSRTRAYVDGQQAGDDLTDNRMVADGYRFHDIFHLGYAAVLNWSPVTRRHLHRKRRSNPVVDEIEDGGRAIVIEEAVAALVFEYAERHKFLEGIATIDHKLLRTIRGMTAHLEVGRCHASLWERAILESYSVWRAVRENGQGSISADLDARTLRLNSTM
jgi:NTP pyrophosphatase (non-canonical NTP hydrolase)